MVGPRPEGWKGGSDDFEFVRTLDGHLGINFHENSELSSNIEARRNCRTTDNVDLGGDYFVGTAEDD